MNLLTTVLVIISTNNAIVSGQGGGDLSGLMGTLQQFSQFYGMATQLMNLGGQFLPGAGGGGSGGGIGSNTIQSEIIPSQQRRSIPESSSSLYSGYGQGPLGAIPSSYGGVQTARSSGIESLLSGFLGGGGLLGGGGNSGGGGGLGGLSSLFGGGGGSGGGGGGGDADLSSPGTAILSQNPGNSRTGIDSIIDALVKSGAQPATPEQGNESLLRGFFGRRR